MSKRKQRILVVDDDMDMVRSLKENLLEMSDTYDVKTSDDGKNALEILGKEKLDLVILNIRIPGINGLRILTELHNKGIWLPIIITTDSNLNEKNGILKDFGIVDLIKKPFRAEEIVIKIEEIMRNREKKDLIKNFSLPSILQLIDMEKRTGILTIKIGKENGRLFFKDGKVMDIEVKGFSREEALQEFINYLYEDRDINIEYINHRKDKKINMTVMEMVMEASRIRDEIKKSPGSAGLAAEKKKIANDDKLPIITGLLHTLKEVESYMVADAEGEMLTASTGNYNEDVLNSSFYLWVIGDKIGDDLKLGKPANFICHFKAGKRLIKKYKDYIIILELTKMTKTLVFKEKLNKHFNQLTWQIGSRSQEVNQ
ncbi:MAG: response regulator [Candidatus Aminicenantes bacterium]|nr:response regulator [Candidatus Aminicenantes bacterium]NIM79270.1 response regulator [Candidatus Aminicenantes bacterium]NIN18556.1 response regulator [Candidatus Aminicenantes bacterium]NIN42453.1 response regulator [Candidatus Aminicenantes bacterium]NIN85211.1 response regulator [Candidatus Aminicenantes bacterium]